MPALTPSTGIAPGLASPAFAVAMSCLLTERQGRAVVHASRRECEAGLLEWDLARGEVVDGDAAGEADVAPLLLGQATHPQLVRFAGDRAACGGGGPRQHVRR